MSTNFKLAPFGLPFIALLFCSCASVVPTSHPGEVDINSDAGRGGLLMVKIQLEDGEDLPFVLDTGAQVTLLDESLESRLGKRLGTRVFHHFSDKFHSHVYAAPRLTLNGTCLLTGRKVYTGDFKTLSSLWRQPTMGILGMDCLRHYCLQLDFADMKLRFLNTDRLDAANLGERYPLHFSFPMCSPFVHERGLAGEREEDVLVDTGYSADGASKADHSAHALAQSRIQKSGNDGHKYTLVSTCRLEHRHLHEPLDRKWCSGSR